MSDRAQALEQRADLIDRSQHGVSSDDVDQAAHLAEDPGQVQDGVVQILDQEVQPRKGVPEQQVFHALTDLVSVEEDVVRIPHTSVDGC